MVTRQASMTVRVSDAYKVLFPDRCVRCGIARPNGRMRILVQHWGHWLLFLLLPALPALFEDDLGLVGDLHSDTEPIRRLVSVPVCGHCKPIIGAEVRDPWLASVILLITGVVTLLLLSQDIHLLTPLYWTGTLLAVVMLPPLLWHQVVDPTIRISQPSGYIYVTFANRFVGGEFAKINDGTVIPDREDA